jgi:hypothetical protein
MFRWLPQGVSPEGCPERVVPEMVSPKLDPLRGYTNGVSRKGGRPRLVAQRMLPKGGRPRVVAQEGLLRAVPQCGSPRVGPQRFVPKDVSPKGCPQGVSPMLCPKRGFRNGFLQGGLPRAFPQEDPGGRSQGGLPQERSHNCGLPMGVPQAGYLKGESLGGPTGVDTQGGSPKWRSRLVSTRVSPSGVALVCPPGGSPIEALKGDPQGGAREGQRRGVEKGVPPRLDPKLGPKSRVPRV